jgi:hypothetical protein
MSTWNAVGRGGAREGTRGMLVSAIELLMCRAGPLLQVGLGGSEGSSSSPARRLMRSGAEPCGIKKVSHFCDWQNERSYPEANRDYQNQNLMC